MDLALEGIFYLVTMIFIFQMLDLLSKLMVAEEVAGIVIDIEVGMEVVKVAREVAQMVDSVFALILCSLEWMS